jgi:hypothetical protein
MGVERVVSLSMASMSVGVISIGLEEEADWTEGAGKNSAPEPHLPMEVDGTSKSRGGSLWLIGGVFFGE